MKRFFLFVLAATVFAACSTDMTQDLAPEIPDTLTVSFDEETRVQLDAECKTVWNADDLVSVFYRSDANDCWRFMGETGDRTGLLVSKTSNEPTISTNEVVAVYPYNAGYCIDASDKTLSVRIPATQRYENGSYGIGANIMVSTGTGRDISLKSVCGWIKLQFTGSGKVTQVTLRGNDDEQIAGLATVNYADYSLSLIADGLGDAATDGEVGGTLVNDRDYVREITLDCGEGVALNADTPTAFYFVLAPQTFEKGITITAMCDDGTRMTKSTSNSITVERNHIVPMETIEYESTYSVGDLYNENGVKGIVFQVDENKKHGKIISMTESRGLYGYDSYVRNCKSTDNGLDNKDALYSAGATYSSSYLMPPKSSVWYIPAIKELEQLIEVIDIVNKSLVSNGGKSFTFSAYGNDALYTSSTNANIDSRGDTVMYGKYLSNPDAITIFASSGMSSMVRCRTITTF